MNNILLVDDDPINLNLMKNILQSEGMAVQCSISGEEALQLLSKKSFTLMITDWNMPGMDGLTLARQATAIAPDMSVIMMTGNVSPEIPSVAKQAGVTKILAKPFFSGDLLKAIRGVVGKQRISPDSL